MTTAQVLEQLKETGDPIHGVCGGTKPQLKQQTTQKPTTEPTRNLDYYERSF